jgi:hypothetical protein
MFEFDEQYVGARFSMLTNSLPLATNVKTMGPGDKVPAPTMDQLNAIDADEALFMKHLVGKTNETSLATFEAFRYELQTPALRNATAEQFLAYFG